MKIFLASLWIQILLAIYILLHVWCALPPQKKWRLPVAGFIITYLLLLFCGRFFYEHWNDAVFDLVNAICGVWFIASLYCGMLLVIWDACLVTNFFRPIFPPWIKTYSPRFKLGLFFSMIALVVVFLSAGYYNYSHPKVNHQSIHIPKSAGRMQSIRIAFATDIHAGYVVNRNQVSKYVDFINAQQCDIIILGGDIIDYDLYPLNKQEMTREFQRLQAPLGVYAVMGNHEYRFDAQKKIAWLNQAGITLLKDSVIMPQYAFYLVGRDDKKSPGRRSLNYLLAGLDKSKPIIVASHQPTNIMESVMNDVDFEMMGHVHNGQIWPNNIRERWNWDGYSHGYHKRGDTQFYISSGLGVSGPPFRVFTDSEVVVFEISFQADTH